MPFRDLSGYSGVAEFLIILDKRGRKSVSFLCWDMKKTCRACTSGAAYPLLDEVIQWHFGNPLDHQS